MISGDDLRDARSRRNWTQEELAVLLGVTQRTVTNWEAGRVPANKEARVRDVLGAALAGGDDDLSAYSDVALLAELGRRLAAAARTRGEGGTNDKPSAAPKKSPGSPDAGTQPVDIQDILRQSHGGFRRAAANKGELIDDREAEADPDDFNQDSGE